MLYRKIEQEIRSFLHSNTQSALLITGARQTGKTTIIETIGKEECTSFIEINFLENRQAQNLFDGALNAQGLLLRISAIANARLIPGESVIFLDEVQECKEFVTAIKFLVEEGSYRYILSGSLLGVDLKDIRSVPVGFMEILELYPMDFEEFALANGVSDRVLQSLSDSFSKTLPVDPIVHEKMMELFQLYLIVGGMPAVVAEYVKSNNLQNVLRMQKSILTLYKKDIAKYDPENKLYLEEIFDLIPSELNSKNKRFVMKNLNENFKFSRYHGSFIWLQDAGVALPTFCVSEPKLPLLLSRSTNLFKLFLSDVGLLASMYMNQIQLKILMKEIDINFGSIYENFAAQELKAHGFDLYYYNSKKHGELDFVIEYQGAVLPIEIKSGKGYNRHAALSNILAIEDYNIPRAFVFHNGNISTQGVIQYYPIYMLMFLKQESLPDDMIYKPDFSILK